MFQKIIIPVYGIQPDEKLHQYRFQHLTFSLDANFTLSMINVEQLIMQLGNIAFRTITTQFNLIATVETNYPDKELLESINSEAQGLLGYLWIVKDCAVSSKFGYLFNLATNETYSNLRQYMWSNSSGLYTPVLFSPMEIATMLEFASKFSDLVTKDDVTFNERTRDIQENAETSVSKANFINYNSHDRINRAWIFILKARSTSFLPDKIASYIAVLECLFTTSNEEVSHKVSERVAFYLGGTKDEKAAIFKKVREGYSVRSKYLHGQQLEKKHSNRENLIIISNQLDDICAKRWLKFSIATYRYF